MGASASQETCRPLVWSICIRPHIWAPSWRRPPLWKVPQGWRGKSLSSSLVCFLFQDYIFYLEPDKLESGKGKCSYDPKVDTVSALISESCSSLGHQGQRCLH